MWESLSKAENLCKWQTPWNLNPHLKVTKSPIRRAFACLKFLRACIKSPLTLPSSKSESQPKWFLCMDGGGRDPGNETPTPSLLSKHDNKHSGRDEGWMALTLSTYIVTQPLSVPTAAAVPSKHSHIPLHSTGRNDRAHFPPPWNVVDLHINATWCDLGHAENRELFQAISCFLKTYRQISLIEKGKAGSFKVTSVINRSPWLRGVFVCVCVRVQESSGRNIRYEVRY